MFDSSKEWAAAALLLGYGWVCVWAWRRHQRLRALARPSARVDGEIVLAYASQTGNAEQLARQAAAALGQGGQATALCELGSLDAERLKQCQRLLIVCATYGDGEAPDNAAAFAEKLLRKRFNLQHLRYGILALGDRDYQHFCGFGRALDAWLQTQGAQPMFARLEAHRNDPDTLAAFGHALQSLGAAPTAFAAAPRFSSWQLLARSQLNPGSASPGLYLLRLRGKGAWAAGDLALVQPPHASERPREYSIANVNAAGDVLELLVRLHRRADGSAGLCSQWLCQHLAVGASLQMRLQEHPAFRLGDNAQSPLILIANGSGLAGLRAHLQQRAAQLQRAPVWLIYGERSPQHDRICERELLAWKQAGVITQLEQVFSRSPDGSAAPAPRYVQEQLAKQAQHLKAWLERGAAIYVCGSKVGMGEGVDAVLRKVLGAARVQALAAEGRLRRDVY